MCLLHISETWLFKSFFISTSAPIWPRFVFFSLEIRNLILSFSHYKTHFSKLSRFWVTSTRRDFFSNPRFPQRFPKSGFWRYFQLEKFFFTLKVIPWEHYRCNIKRKKNAMPLLFSVVLFQGSCNTFPRFGYRNPFDVIFRQTTLIRHFMTVTLRSSRNETLLDRFIWIKFHIRIFLISLKT